MTTTALPEIQDLEQANVYVRLWMDDDRPRPGREVVAATLPQLERAGVPAPILAKLRVRYSLP